MIRISLFILILTASSVPVFPQVEPENEKIARQALFAELGGNGVVLTVNYEAEIVNNARLRVGVGTVLFGVGIPATLTFHTSGNHQFVAGGGVVYAKGHFFDEFEALVLTGTFGYQYLPRPGGFFFRAAFTPLLNPGRGKLLPWAGICLGKAF